MSELRLQILKIYKQDQNGFFLIYFLSYLINLSWIHRNNNWNEINLDLCKNNPSIFFHQTLTKLNQKNIYTESKNNQIVFRQRKNKTRGRKREKKNSLENEEED